MIFVCELVKPFFIKPKMMKGCYLFIICVLKACFKGLLGIVSKGKSCEAPLIDHICMAIKWQKDS